MPKTIVIAILGQKGVGKRAFVHRFTTEEFFTPEKIFDPSNNVINFDDNYFGTNQTKKIMMTTNIQCELIVGPDDDEECDDKVPEADGYLIFCSRFDKGSVEKSGSYMQIVDPLNKPYFVCETKADMKGIGHYKDMDFLISSKSVYNIYQALEAIVTAVVFDRFSKN